MALGVAEGSHTEEFAFYEEMRIRAGANIASHEAGALQRLPDELVILEPKELDNCDFTTLNAAAAWGDPNAKILSQSQTAREIDDDKKRLDAEARQTELDLITGKLSIALASVLAAKLERRLWPKDADAVLMYQADMNNDLAPVIDGLRTESRVIHDSVH